MIHVAASDIQINGHLRQRCGWCGELLINVNLDLMQVPIGQDSTYPTWPVGGLVFQEGGVSYTVPLEENLKLPENSCGLLPLEMTV